jgi:hypothetical protein
MANEENLVPFTSEQSREEAVKNGRKGGIASGVARRQKADLRKRLRELVDMPLRAGDIDDIKTLADAKNANLSISDALLAKLVVMALGGNIKAMNTLMGMLGNDPTEAPEAPQSVTSGFIDALNGTAAEVWANEAPEEE